jgi:hypothetical protein
MLYFILNTFVDCNWLAPLIAQARQRGREATVLIVQQDWQKPTIKLDFAAATEELLAFPFLRDVQTKIFLSPADFKPYFRNLTGIIAGTSPTLLALLRTAGKPAGQRWIGFSFFGEDDEVSLVCDRYYVGSAADQWGLPPEKAGLAFPYWDVFNPALYPHLSNYRLDHDVAGYREIITIPYITDAQETWFKESYEYVRRELSPERLFIFKYRKKSKVLEDKLKYYRQLFKNSANVIFYDRPYFDLTAELMRVSTKIVFTRKLTQFIKECFFTAASIEVLHPEESINFYGPRIGLASYDTIFDEMAADKPAARRRHIYQSANNSEEVLGDIDRLGSMRRASQPMYGPRLWPWPVYRSWLLARHGFPARWRR